MSLLSIHEKQCYTGDQEVQEVRKVQESWTILKIEMLDVVVEFELLKDKIRSPKPIYNVERQILFLNGSSTRNVRLGAQTSLFQNIFILSET